jgi:hypothetical protein
LRVVGGCHPDDGDERGKGHADHPHRHVQPDVFSADERDLRREVDDPQRHHHGVPVHEHVGDRRDIEEGAEVVRPEVADEDDEREDDRGAKEQTPIRETPRQTMLRGTPQRTMIRGAP